METARLFAKLLSVVVDHGSEEVASALEEALAAGRGPYRRAPTCGRPASPTTKTLEQIDFEALRGVSKPKLRELASCDYIDRGDDVVLVGPIGAGETHLAIALGIETAKRRYRVAATPSPLSSCLVPQGLRPRPRSDRSTRIGVDENRTGELVRQVLQSERGLPRPVSVRRSR